MISTVISFYADKLYILLQYYFSDYYEKFSVLMKNKREATQKAQAAWTSPSTQLADTRAESSWLGTSGRGFKAMRWHQTRKNNEGHGVNHGPPASDSNKNGYRVFSNQAIVLAVISLSWVSSPLKTPKVCPAPSIQEISASGLCTKAFWMVVAVSGTTDVSLVP